MSDTQKKIFRSRQPIVVGELSGYADFWTADRTRAELETSKSPDRVLEAFTEESINTLPVGQRVKALSAWHNAYL